MWSKHEEHNGNVFNNVNSQQTLLSGSVGSADNAGLLVPSDRNFVSLILALHPAGTNDNPCDAKRLSAQSQ